MSKQIRDKNGNFVPKSKTNIVRHQIRTKKYLIPIMFVVIAVGGYVVSRSFASTTTVYSYTTCQPRYDDTCLRDSAEANIATLYQAVLGRAADPSGLNYYSKKLVSGGQNYGQVASTLLASSKGKERYPSTDPVVYVQTLYANLFNRKPTGAEQNQWVGYIVGKKLNLGQVIARLALQPEYKADQESENLVLLKERYKIVQPTGPYTTVANFDLAGKDSKLCPGKVQSVASVGGNACIISSKESESGVYEKVLSVPVGAISPGTYDFVYSGEFVVNGSRNHKVVLSKSDMSTSVSTNHIAGAGETHFFGSRNYKSTDKSEYSADFYYDRPTPTPNAYISIYLSDLDVANITKLELRKRTDNLAYKFMLLSEPTYTGFTKDIQGTYSFKTNNPAISSQPDSPGYKCAFKHDANKCVMKVKHSVPAGKYMLLPEIYVYNGYGAPTIPIATNIKVTRIDTQKTVSKAEARLEAPDLNGVYRTYPLPLDIRKWYRNMWATPVVEYSLDKAATVEIELSFEQDKAPEENTDKFAYMLGATRVEVWSLGSYVAR